MNEFRLWEVFIESEASQLDVLCLSVQEANFSGAGFLVLSHEVWNPVFVNELRLNGAIVLVVQSSEVESVLEHWHWRVQSSLFFKFIVSDDGITIVFELLYPTLLFQAAHAIGEGFFLSPENVMREESWVGDVNCFSKMVLLNSVSWAFNVGWKVEIVLHPSLV